MFCFCGLKAPHFLCFLALVFGTSGHENGAAPKPVVWLVKETEDQVQLHCVVLGAFPKPKVEWKDSDGNIFPAEEPQVLYRGDRYYITLLTTVTGTNTGLFHCVATQEEIGHVIEAEIRVPDNPLSPPMEVVCWQVYFLLDLLLVHL